MRKITLGFAAIAIAIATLTFGADTARALDFSITFGTGQPPIVRHNDHREALPVTPYTHRPVVPHRQTTPQRKAAPHRQTAPQRKAAPPPRYDDRWHWRDQRSHWRDQNRYDRRDRRWRDDRRSRSQSCTVRTERYWDGRGWVTDRRRVCR